MSTENLPMPEESATPSAEILAAIPEYWQSYLDELERLCEQALDNFGKLGAEQLNWQASPETWSVAQCLEHLVKINSDYFPTFDHIIGGNKKTSFMESLPVLPSFFGKVLLKELDSNRSKKHKAIERYLPSSHTVAADIVEQFVAHQHQLVQYLRDMAGADHQHIIITSPVASLITYSLKDAIAVIVVHEQRHMLQAQNVLKNALFPKYRTEMPESELALPKIDAIGLTQTNVLPETEADFSDNEPMLGYETTSLDLSDKKD